MPPKAKKDAGNKSAGSSAAKAAATADKQQMQAAAKEECLKVGTCRRLRDSFRGRLSDRATAAVAFESRSRVSTGQEDPIRGFSVTCWRHGFQDYAIRTLSLAKHQKRRVVANWLPVMREVKVGR